MMSFRFVRGAAVALACVGLMVPQSGLRADDAVAAKSQSQVRIANFALSATGTLPGTVMNRNGDRIDGSLVTLRQGNKVVAKTTTTADGTYKFENLKNGDYVLSVGQQSGVVRLWTAGTAPAKAESKATVIVGDQVVRGQEFYDGGYAPPVGLDFVTLITVGAAITAATLSGIALSKINDVEDDIEGLQSP